MATIAVDFDGTLCEDSFPEIGKAREPIVNNVRELKNEGNTIILWTCREDRPDRAYLSEALEWCENQNIPIDFINEYPNPGFTDHAVTIKCRKLFADIYIDDRAVDFDRINENNNV